MAQFFARLKVGYRGVEVQCSQCMYVVVKRVHMVMKIAGVRTTAGVIREHLNLTSPNLCCQQVHADVNHH